MNVDVNWLAVLVAAVVAMAIGFIYYSKVVMGKAWMKEKGYTDESLKAAQKTMGPLYAISFVAALVTAFVLAHIIGLSQDFYGYEPIQTGLISAFWVWLGFIMPVQLTEQIFGEKKWRLFGINTVHQLITVLAMGVVIGWL
ncbi:MAG: DUF1761 domain-containing protein [Candidatus Woykebacteria bacterium]